ncbi:MAG: alpha/beta hydrolase [Verrucomicrobia bacterium]|nr:alpha/beta hydrolase [Verrucomicrobiota bacterium]
MKPTRCTFFVRATLLVAAAWSLVQSADLVAADITGTWKAECDTQIGTQKYTYTLKQDGEKFTGKAASDIGGEKRDVELKDVKLSGDEVIFFETFEFQGNAIRIDYKGKVAGDEIKFTRKVGDFATEELVAKRAKTTAAATASSAAASSPVAEGKVVRLYDGPAPGSENWTHSEKESRTNLWNTRVAFNVANPTLTVFPANSAKANGTAVVICPGGAFFGLSIDSEGNDVARWLNDKGVACFVLKYRLVECKTDDPTRELMTRGNLDPIVAPIVKLAMADGNAAIGHVRKHAQEYGVNPERIGIVGFSAGGTVTASVAYNYTPETRPNFVAPIYLAYNWTIKPNGVPADAPPMFVLAATDDPLGLAPQSVAIYQDWVAAKKPAELHLFSKGGHGFGMRKQNLPSDHWVERFADWLDVQGLLKK